MVESASRWADELRPPAIWSTGFFEDLKRRAMAAAADAENAGFCVGCDVWLSIDRDRASARALGRRILAQFLPLPQLKPMRDFAEIDQNEVDAVDVCLRGGDIDAAADAISDRTLDTFVAAGTPDDLRPGLERLVAAGPSTITFSGRLGPDPVVSLELLGAELLPYVTA
jgi:alkanesulfonate monooxygenase SsuD/methylene tetrahydromethanopterin reductase-like flavin-dependent oxidoreductase (luciferase family)